MGFQAHSELPRRESNCILPLSFGLSSLQPQSTIYRSLHYWVEPVGCYTNSARGATANQLVPVQVPGITTATQVSAGDGHSAILLANRSMYTCGCNGGGQLGNGDVTLAIQNYPTKVLLDNVVWASARDHHSTAILSNGSVFGWGSGTSGELGNGHYNDSVFPVEVLF